MDALVMCGGRGTRLDADAEKPLFRVGGEPMIDRVLATLADSRIDRVYAVVSPHTPETADHLGSANTGETDDPEPIDSIIETPGEDYVADLDRALTDGRIGEPILTVAADLPLLDAAVIDDVLDAHVRGSLTVAVPACLKLTLDVSCDTTVTTDGEKVAPTGVNVVGGEPETIVVRDDARLAVNVNRTEDAAVAERLLGAQG